MRMFSARSIAAALVLGAAGIVATAAQAGVVIASSGPSAAQYPKGKKLADTDQITLKAGDSVTILDASGTRVLSGAGSYRAGGRGEAQRSTFATLTRQRSAQRVRTGAVRGGETDGPIMSPSLWYVDVTKSGNFCVADPADVQLWRPGSEGDSTYEIANEHAPGHVHVTFDNGATTAQWSTEQMPLVPGAVYSITGPNGSPKTDVRFTVLSTVADSPEALAEELMDKGCQAQVDLLAAKLMTTS
ncbi:MAG: hypothetical protein ACTHK5_06480 [Tsuneonella sp.]